MSSDQNTPADPTTQHAQPDTAGGQNIPHPGLTSDMSEQPDHGEETYIGTGKLTGRRAIITGGDSGIGRAVAIAFAREGADVLIAYLPDEEEDAQQTVRLIEDAGRRAVTVPGDIRREEHCQLIIDTAVRELGGIDILVNNAAYQMTQAGRHRGHHHRAVGSGAQDEPVRDVLAHENGGPPFTTRIQHHQHGLYSSHRTLTRAARLRHDKGRHRELR